MRKQRKQQLEEHVQAINVALRKSVGYENGENDSDDEESAKGEWEGIEEPPPVNHEDEYVDEDKYTTVTVETVGISRDGFVKPGGESESEDGADGVVEVKKPHGRGGNKTDPQAYPVKKEKKKALKKKKIKFKYEGKEERKVTRMKERSKNMLQAKARREGQAQK
jgi:ribosomal RNA-processing protein 17